MVLRERLEYHNPVPPDLAPGNLATVVSGIKQFLTGCRQRRNGMKRVGKYDESVPYDMKIRELEVELAIAELLENAFAQAVKGSIPEGQEKLTEREVHILVQKVPTKDVLVVLDLMFIAKWGVIAKQEPQRYIRISDRLLRPVTEVLAGALRLKARVEAVGSA